VISLPSIQALDSALFVVINHTTHPLADLFFYWLTDRFFWMPLYVVLFFFIKKNREWKGLLIFSLTIVISDQCSASLLKPFFARYRPCYDEYLLSIHSVHLVGEHIGIYGFPSSHASNTFAFATLFWRIFHTHYPHTYLFFIWSTIISYGRIYGGMHYPLDVMVGAILGTGIGLLAFKAIQFR